MLFFSYTVFVFQLLLQFQLFSIFQFQLQLQLTDQHFSVILLFQLQLQLIEITLGVALIKKLTAREEQLEFLLQVVSDHRHKFPDCSEKTVMATYSGKLVINFNT